MTLEGGVVRGDPFTDLIGRLRGLPDDVTPDALVATFADHLASLVTNSGVALARTVDTFTEILAATGSLVRLVPGHRVAWLDRDPQIPWRLDADDLAVDVGRPVVGIASERALVVLFADVSPAGVERVAGLVELLDLEFERRRVAGELRARTGELESLRAHQVVVERDREAARESAETTAGRLASLVGAGSIAILGTDHTGAIQLWNPGAETLLGWSAAEVIGRDAVTLLLPPGSALDVPDLRRAIASGGTIPFVETVAVHRDGHHLEIEGTVGVMYDSEGAAVGASVVLRDVSERNDALRALADREEVFRLLAENSQDVVYRLRLRPEPVVEYVSPSATGRLGFTPAQLCADPELLGARVHPEDRGQLLDVAGLTESTPDRIMVRFQHGDGRWRWLEDIRSPLLVEGELVGVSGVLRDVTLSVTSEQRLRATLSRERAAADQLRRVDEMKTTFLSAVSHELRTPLTSILGFTETAERALASGRPAAEVQPYVGRALANARRLQQLIVDLLDVDRLTRGAASPQRASTDLVVLVTEQVARTEPGDRRLVTDVPASLVVDVDAPMIERTVDNLLRNAVRHTPKGTTIWVRLWREPTGVRLVVEDDGPGVPAASRERLFAPFEQGADAHKAPSPGTGIGLALVERFVDVHGGTVSLDERPGGGARFTVQLPTDPPQRAPVP